MTQRDEREKLADAMSTMKRNAHRRFVMAFEVKDRDLIVAALRAPADGEAHAEIQRLQDAKRRALALADERAKENVALREALKDAVDVFEGMNDDEINVELMPRLRAALSHAPPASEGVRESNEEHYLKCIKLRLETLYELTEAPNLREQISDEIDWVNEKLGDPAEPAATPDEGPDPLGYAKGERL